MNKASVGIAGAGCAGASGERAKRSGTVSDDGDGAEAAPPYRMTDRAGASASRTLWPVDRLLLATLAALAAATATFHPHPGPLLLVHSALALFHMRLEQAVESKTMIQRSQEIAYFTLEEVNLKPGTQPDKVKAISVLTKAVVECHEALSTSDMALKDVLKQFERFRMEHPQQIPPDIRQLAPLGNFTGGGAAEKDDKKNGLPN